MRCKVHTAASYVIGRRAMGFKEHMPAYLRKLIPEDMKRANHWKQAALLFKATKNISAEIFRRTLPDFTDRKQLDQFKKWFYHAS